MGRLTSRVWNFFSPEGNGKAKCRLCSGVLSMVNGSHGNLSRHVRLKHGFNPRNSDAPAPKDTSVSDLTVAIGEEVEDWVPDGQAPTLQSESCQSELRRSTRSRQPPPHLEDYVEMQEEGAEFSTTNDESANFGNIIVIEPKDYLPSPSIPTQAPKILHTKRKSEHSEIVVRSDTQTYKKQDQFTTWGMHIGNMLAQVPYNKILILDKLIADIILEAQSGNVDQFTRISFHDTSNPATRNVPTPLHTPNPPQQNPVIVVPESPLVATPQPPVSNPATLPGNVILYVTEGKNGQPISVQMVPSAKHDGSKLDELTSELSENTQQSSAQKLFNALDLMPK